MRVRLTRAALAALVLVTLLSGIAAVTRADAPKTKLSIAVLRRDGVILPFASFDDGDWSVPWPGPLQGIHIPLSFAQVPKKWWGPFGPLTPWTAWKTGAGRLTPVRLAVKSLAQVKVFCEPRLGLLTDYHHGPLDESALTVPKDGVAIAGDVPLMPIDAVPPSAEAARTMAGLIAAEFNDEEERASHDFTRWKHPFDKAARQKIPIEIEAYYRASETTDRGTWTTSYVEAVRKFPPGPKDNGCGLITYANAWIRHRPDTADHPSIDLTARITYCDREGVAFMMPFGRLAAKGEVYWVFQMSSWRDELYFVSRMRPDEVRPVVIVSGGACPREPR